MEVFRSLSSKKIACGAACASKSSLFTTRRSGFASSASAGKRSFFTTRRLDCELSTNGEQLWEDLFANPSHWWDNRLDKIGSSYPDFRHKSTRQPLWLNSPHIPSWVHAKLASIDVHQGGKYPHLSTFHAHSIHEFHMLCQHGQLDMALHVLYHMRHAPTENMYYSLLRACNQREALVQVELVHTHMVNDPLACNGFLGEYLVITLAKCGDILNALHVFHGLLHQTVFSWTAIISGLTDRGKFFDALNMYSLMQQDGIVPNDHTFVSLSKACGCICDLEEGKRLHIEEVKYGYESDLFVGTSLIDMYGKCGSVEFARSVFDGLLHRNVVSWTAMLSTHFEHGQLEPAWQLYGQMQQEGVSPDDRAIVIALQGCCMLAEEEKEFPSLGQSTRMIYLSRGRGLHIEATLKGLDLDVFIGNSLISFYGLCGSISEAECVFAQLLSRDVVSWNALVSVYVEVALPKKALQLFRQLKELGVPPDDRSFVSALQACGMLVEEEEEAGFTGESIKAGALAIGLALHSESRSKQFDVDLFVCHTAINMYGKCGRVGEAENAFNGLSEHSVVAWNVMSLAYLKQGDGEKVLQIYKKMHDEGLVVNERTFVNALQSCCLLAEKEPLVVIDKDSPKFLLLTVGKALHADAQRRGFDLHPSVSSSLISLYEKCGSLAEANNVFCELAQDSAETWNAMLLAFVEQGEGRKALLVFEQMQDKAVAMTNFTLVCALQACSEAGTVETCKEIHFAAVCAGDDERIVMANTLIHAYGTCASMLDAQAIFNVMPSRDVASWNALIGSYARRNDWAASLYWYERMQGTSVKPDGVTFLSVFSACSHTGLVKKGLEYLASMSIDLKLNPELRHYSSVIELLGQAGHFVRVKDFLSSMPMQPDLTIWLCLLGACQMHGNVKLGKHAYDQAVRLQRKQAVGGFCKC